VEGYCRPVQITTRHNLWATVFRYSLSTLLGQGCRVEFRSFLHERPCWMFVSIVRIVQVEQFGDFAAGVQAILVAQFNELLAEG
jgi:hypothetical protein